MSVVTFQNISDQRIRKAFLIAVNQYSQLKNHRIALGQVRLKKTTMQAQPVVSMTALLSGKLSYQIKLAEWVRDSQSLRVDALPTEVLTGWFAHELGHVLDYTSHSTLGMVLYGLRYSFSSQFRKKVEHRADELAVNHGFESEILAVKRFIFNHDLIDDRYKNQMKKYYMSIRDVETCVQNKDSFVPKTSDVS